MKKVSFIIAILLVLLATLTMPALAAGPTTSVHVVKYMADGSVLAEVTRTYAWLEANLPVQGDGSTHYYHQGPVFEGDMWDPAEMQNLKDKGAVKGTALRDLCGLVGGMSPGDELMVKAADGWHTEFAYENIYEPMEIQGVISLCWYNGGTDEGGEGYGTGYPGNTGYYSAMQLVFMAGTPNSKGNYVFGNSDMTVCLPDEKYQHFYEGLPSTNGLSGKWISEVAIFSGEAPVTPGEKLAPDVAALDDGGPTPVALYLGLAGAVIVAGSVALLLAKRSK